MAAEVVVVCPASEQTAVMLYPLAHVGQGCPVPLSAAAPAVAFP